jgi:hypothetical protein
VSAPTLEERLLCAIVAMSVCLDEYEAGASVSTDQQLISLEPVEESEVGENDGNINRRKCVRLRFTAFMPPKVWEHYGALVKTGSKETLDALIGVAQNAEATLGRAFELAERSMTAWMQRTDIPRTPMRIAAFRRDVAEAIAGKIHELQNVRVPPGGFSEVDRPQQHSTPPIRPMMFTHLGPLRNDTRQPGCNCTNPFDEAQWPSCPYHQARG